MDSHVGNVGIAGASTGGPGKAASAWPGVAWAVPPGSPPGPATFGALGEGDGAGLLAWASCSTKNSSLSPSKVSAKPGPRVRRKLTAPV